MILAWGQEQLIKHTVSDTLVYPLRIVQFIYKPI